MQTTLAPRLASALLALPAGRRSLRRGPVFDDTTWSALVACHQPDDSTEYLCANLTRARVAKLLDWVDRVDLDDLFRSDVDYSLSAWIKHYSITRPLRNRVLRTQLPAVSAQALASSAFTLTEKQAIAKKAYLSARLTWLNSKECDALADSTVYALATAPDVMADRFAHSMFHDQMSVHTFNQQAQLLYLRPALIDAALASGDPQWYHAAACVPLSRDQQLALITLCEAYWSSSDEYRPDYLRNRSELLADPLSTLACTPWRIPEVEHRLANNPPLFKGAGTIKQGELQDGYYWRIDPSQYPPCDLASASAAQADTWVNYRVHALSSHSLAIPFVVLEAYRNKGLTAAQVSYRRNLLGTVAPSISSVLARRRRYVPKAGHATGLNYNPPERTARGPAPTPALPHVHVSWAWQNYDVGIAALTAAGLSDRQLELAYALILDSIDTDLAGLIALVTQL